MQEKIKKLLDYAVLNIGKADSTADLFDTKVKLLGKNGELTALLKGLKDASPEEKPSLGKLLNDVRVAIEEKIDSKLALLAEKEKIEKLNAEELDVTLEKDFGEIGSLHPLTLVKNEICEILYGLGFVSAEGPEIETDYYNFQALNVPGDHPARDMQDTFYITPEFLLRTQTSAMQARIMEKQKPPIRLICPGKVYRADDDASHSPMFQQIEGLVVDKHVTLCDLQGVLGEFVKGVFNENTKIRFRPSYFPFTEPSVEVDVSCSICGGKGCRICKGTGWLEILGAGIVNPWVLDNSGIDSAKYSGFAFGLGVERIAMLKYGIPDMRILFENDVRFLKQYR